MTGSQTPPSVPQSAGERSAPTRFFDWQQVGMIGSGVSSGRENDSAGYARLVPAGVLGGMTTALYGPVGVIGVHIWVTNRVDFGLPINQFTAAAPIVIGIADFERKVGDLDSVVLHWVRLQPWSSSAS